MAEFRRDHLPGFNALCERGVRYTQHRINTSACAPSRTSMLTGYSPWIHGVTQTDGLAKRYDDPEQIWLSPERVPTLGHRFQAAGWQSVYVGKWHLSHADLEPVSGESYSDTVSRYRDAKLLSPYGFEHWVGPEPHGADIRNAGVHRDSDYLNQAKAFLENRAVSNDDRPFLLVFSLVNPHDIVFWPAWSLWQRSLLDLDGIPEIGEAPSESLLVEDEPEALKAYRHAYYGAYGPRRIVDWIYRRDRASYRRFYASLIRRSDRHIVELLETLKRTGLEDSTHVVCTSDHGELLGSHGGLHQKWYNAFEETLRVPMVISEASASNNQRASECRHVTSHQDLVPTLLGLAEIEESIPDVSADHFKTVPILHGRDICRPLDDGQSYFVTFDDILSGQSPEAALGRRFKWLGAIWKMRYPNLDVEHNAVEAWIGRAPESDPTGALWKIVRYFDPRVVTETRIDDWQLFNLSTDATEISNLRSSPDAEPIFRRLQALLVKRRDRARGV